VRESPNATALQPNFHQEMEVSIVMPCLNEAETVGRCTEKALGFLRANAVSGEVIVADNGSTDGSQAIAERHGARVVSVLQRGYGAALMGGILQARGRYIIMGDADDSYDFTSLLPYLTALREGNDLVMGNRFHGGIKPGAMPPLHRYFGNPVLTLIGRMFFKSPSRDFHCGLRGFRRAAALEMDLRTTGMEFASELVVKASLLGMRVTEVPTVLSPDGRSRPPHLRSWRDGWRHLRFLLMYSPRWLFLYPGMAVMLIGLAMMLWLLPGTRRVGTVGIDIHTLIYAGLAIVVGFQSVVFAVFTKVFAISEGLLPPDPVLDKLFRYVTLEVGAIVGAVIAFVGLAGTAYAVVLWSDRSFGPMDPGTLLRIVVPSGVCLTLGYQIVLSSFFLSILGLRRRKDSAGLVL
jgi:glycosyltransferase involved in cell wall biosynthesis